LLPEGVDISPIPNSRRFFVDPPLLQADDLLLADRDLARQLSRVLRLRRGDRILLLDGQGQAAAVELQVVDRDQVAGRVLARFPAGGEPGCHITAYVGLSRPERFEWALQKGTEVGISAFVPLECERSLAAERAEARKLERWRRIIREAAEQSCRGRLPELQPPLDFAAACRTISADLALLLWEGTAPPLRRILQQQPAPPGRVAMLSGPEGGLSNTELTQAHEHGIIPVSLGPRILRAETAPVVAGAILSYAFEQFAG
jgi:16S rRNA (uracil1498-N3)-methyltransferase